MPFTDTQNKIRIAWLLKLHEPSSNANWTQPKVLAYKYVEIIR